MTEVIDSLAVNKNIGIGYEIGKNSPTPTNFVIIEKSTGKVIQELKFQDGAIQEVGINGIQNEDVIVCVLERLRAFQNGDFKCRENAIAITKLEEALLWLRQRTFDREYRKVEGQNKK